MSLNAMKRSEGRYRVLKIIHRLTYIFFTFYAVAFQYPLLDAIHNFIFLFIYFFRYSLWETKHCLWMDPRRELVAIQIAHTQAQAQAHNAAVLAAVTDITTVTTTNTAVNAVSDVIDSSAISDGRCHDINGNVSTVPVSDDHNNKKCHKTLQESFVSTDANVEDVRAMTPIASSIVNAEGQLTSSYNPRTINRINLLAPAPATKSTHTVTDNNSAVNGLHRVPMGSVSVGAVRAVHFCNIMDAWRGRVQAHAVRLMNARGNVMIKCVES